MVIVDRKIKGAGQPVRCRLTGDFGKTMDMPFACSEGTVVYVEFLNGTLAACFVSNLVF